MCGHLETDARFLYRAVELTADENLSVLEPQRKCNVV